MGYRERKRERLMEREREREMEKDIQRCKQNKCRDRNKVVQEKIKIERQEQRKSERQEQSVGGKGGHKNIFCRSKEDIKLESKKETPHWLQFLRNLAETVYVKNFLVESQPVLSIQDHSAGLQNDLAYCRFIQAYADTHFTTHTRNRVMPMQH